MIDWHPVTSSRITHEAYDAEREIIYVRFPDGGEHQYEACPIDVWEAFTAAGQSRGEFIRDVLDDKPHRKHVE